MAEDVLEAVAVEEDVPDAVLSDEPAQVRRLPVPRRSGEEVELRNEMATAALAAAGGLAAGAVTVAVVRAIGAVSRSRSGRIVTKGRKPAKVVASRSFLVDIHVLGDR